MDINEIKKGMAVFCEAVTKLEILQYENIKEGNVTLSGETINVQTTNNLSFRIHPGDPQFQVWKKKITIGYTVIIAGQMASMKANPFNFTRTSPSGESIPETRTYFNISNVEVLAIQPPTIDERFADLPDVEGEIQKTIRKGGDFGGGAGAKGGNPDLNTNALSSSEGPTL